MDPRLDAKSFQACTVKSLRYHTTGDNNDVEHNEGDEYQVETADLMRTLVACQFADFKEIYVPPDPPPEG